jgi:hypothetical protein
LSIEQTGNKRLEKDGAKTTKEKDYLTEEDKIKIEIKNNELLNNVKVKEEIDGFFS